MEGTFINGFWDKRLSLLNSMDEDERPEFDDQFDEFGFEFMEKTSSDKDDILDSLADQLVKANACIGHREAKEVIRPYSAYAFLHGDCNIFAQYLNRKYGYSVEAVYEPSDWGSRRKKLVHMYCTYEEDGKTVYVDVRGKCDDWDLFMKEFYDLGLWGNDDSTAFGYYNEVPKKYRASREDGWRLRAAAVYDEKYGCYSNDSKAA